MARSLKFYTSLYAAGVSLLIFVAAGVVFLQVRDLLKSRAEADIDRALANKVETVGQFIRFYQGITDRLTHSAEAQDILLFTDHEAAQKWSTSLRRRLPDVVGVALFTDKGVILGKASSQRVGPLCLKEMKQRIKGRPVVTPSIHREIPRFAHFDLVAMVRHGSDKIGLVFISISLQSLQQKLGAVTATDSEIVELQDLNGRMLLRTRTRATLKNPVARQRRIAGTDWLLVYKTETPPLQDLYITFAVITFLTAIVIAALAVFLTSFIAKWLAWDFARISGNLTRAVQGHGSRATNEFHLRETSDMMPMINAIADQIQKRQQSLLELSLTDELTGLPNRRSMQTAMKQFINFPSRGIHTCVCIIDIDYFKNINDRFGHLVGDSVLLALARVLKSAQRGSDFIARLGGDEFIVTLIDMETEHIEEWLNRIRKEFRADSAGLATDVPMEMRSLSCGYVCLEPDPDLTISDILRMADEALYEAKGRGRDVVVQYRKKA